MGRTRPSRLIAGLVAAIVIVGGGAVAAQADQLVVDGLAPIDHPGQPATVAVCAGQSTQVSVLIAARRQGGGEKVFANNSVVNVTVGSATAGLSASLSDGTITIPGNWQNLNNTLSSDTLTAVVTVPPKTALGTGTVTFAFSGVNPDGNPYDGTEPLTVNWTIRTGAGCDTTAPDLQLPANITAEATSASGATVTYGATATDANPLSPTPAVTCTPSTGSVFPIATTTVECSATDAAGNVRDGSFTVTVGDTTAPTIGQPTSIQTEATGATTVVSWTPPAANDLVDGVRPVTCIPSSGSAFSVGSTEVTCSSADTRGNSASSTFTVTILDTTAPTLVIPADFAAEATSAAGATVTFATSANDIVDGAVAVLCAPASGSTFPVGPTTVDCSATDAAGKIVSDSFVVTVQDTIAPVVTVPTNQVIEATGPNGATATFVASATDAVSGSPSTMCNPVSGSTFSLGATTVECYAMDGAGNKGSASFAVTVRDTTAPVITVPTETIVLEATGSSGAVLDHYPVSATDLVDTSVDVTCEPAPGSTFDFGSTQVDCNAVDDAGNHASAAAFAVVVQDTTGPAVTAPDDESAEATSAAGAVVTYGAATATDLVDGDRPVTCTPVSGSTFALGTTIVTCTAKDTRDNEGSDTLTVTVVDTTAPAIAVPEDVEDVEATGPAGATVTYTGVSAVDVVDGVRPVSCLPASGTAFALGTTIVTCTAMDTRDNEDSETFRVTVVDTTAPAITVPDDVTEEATGQSGAAVTYSDASAVDLVDGDRPVECLPASGSTFALGNTTITCTATDTRGNKGSETFTVTVKDTTGPTVTAPDDVQKEATGPSGATVTYSGASAEDLVDGLRSVTCSPPSGSTFALGETTVTCTAKDSRDNIGSDDFTVRVVDTTAPVVTVPVDKTAEATSSSGALVTYGAATAYDIVDTNVTPVTCSPAAGSTFALGTTTVTCSATDAHGNEGSNTFTVSVVDTTSPTITVPATITRAATGPTGAVVTYAATAHDLVDGDVTTSCTPASGSTFAPGSTTVTCAATDRAGNTVSKSFTVKVQYSLLGFYQPVDMSGVLNTVKGGSTVPLKFEVFAGGTELTSTTVVSGFAAIKVACDSLNASSDEIEFVSTGGTTLRYDTTGGQFIQNWQTPKKPGECFQVTMTTTGGASLVAFFKLK